jgi:hypothetical protein
MPDPAGLTRDQGSGIAAFDYIIGFKAKGIASEMPGRFRPAVQWPIAREMAKSALNRQHGRDPWIRICPVGCKPLIRALRGGWHYGQNTKAGDKNAKPVKDINSHPGDCFAGGVGLISGDYDALVKGQRKKRQRMNYGRVAAQVI